MEEIKTEKIIQEIREKIEGFTGIVSSIAQNEIVKTALETSKFIDTAIKINNQIIQKRFESFLKGFSQEEPTDKQLIKLMEYIDDENKAEFIADSFRKVLLSNSSLATLTMGSLLNSIIDNNRSITHEDLLCINALSQFYDVDLRNFKLIAELANYNGDLETKKRAVIRFNRQFNEIIKEKQISRISLILTLEKSANLQLLFKEYESDVDVDFDMADVSNNDIEEYFVINSVGKSLLKYIDRIGRI